MVSCGTTPDVWQIGSLKTCTKCLADLPHDMFPRRSGAKLRATCRVCHNAAERARNAGTSSESRQKKSERNAQWRAKRVAEGRPLPDRSEAQAAWRLRDPEKTRALRRAKYLKDKEKPGYQEKQKDYMRNRRANVPEFRFASHQRARIRGELTNLRKKGGSFYELLGCRPIEAIKILTNGGRSIPDGMHVDHHVPVASFDLSQTRDQFVCFNWRNLRLLPRSENERKHAKIPSDAGNIVYEIASCLSLDSSHL